MCRDVKGSTYGRCREQQMQRAKGDRRRHELPVMIWLESEVGDRQAEARPQRPRMLC